jgi:hypothetical protein
MKKLFILSATALLLAAACNKTQPPINQQTIPTTDTKVQQNATSSSTSNVQEQAKQNPPKEDLLPDAQVTVQQTVEGSNLNRPQYTIMMGADALTLLQSTHKVETKDYGSTGKFVLSIDGVTPDSKHFWEFFVNGKSSNVGASSYMLKPDDKLEWKLSAISSSGQ